MSNPYPNYAGAGAGTPVTGVPYGGAYGGPTPQAMGGTQNVNIHHYHHNEGYPNQQGQDAAFSSGFCAGCLALCGLCLCLDICF